MKLLVVVSSLDLTQTFSATPAWWQLLKALYEVGVEVIATPYQGPAMESLWWRAEKNPARVHGEVFSALRGIARVVMPPPAVQMEDTTPADEAVADTFSDKATRTAANTFVTPLWRRHLEQILLREPDIDAIMFLTVPLNHFNGVPRFLSETYQKPVFYFDGDVPASLPNMKGFASGFRIYQGADMSEYTAFISNSKGGEELLLQLGAKHAHTVLYGADPDVFSPVPVPTQDIDVFFYGHGREYRSEWIDAMITEPSNQLSDYQFSVRGTKLGDVGKTELLPYLSFSKLREYSCRSKINLCITRGAHASVYGSSSSRPFELSSMGACIVANPYDGLEEWFEPDKEIILLTSAEEAIDRYSYLLKNDTQREAIGKAARERVLKEHTFRHRARDLVRIIKSYI
jgi:spore maturation protein CgeB